MSKHNKKAKGCLSLWVAAAGLLISSSLYAGIPVWTYSAPSPAGVTISDGRTATVQYTVTNQSHKAKNLILRATPGLSASACHLAGKGSTCNVTLTINGSLIPNEGVHSGPVLCEQGNPNQCYQPGAANVLNVVKSTNPLSATINVAPSTLNLTQGGSAQTVTVTNTSTIAAESLQATIPGTSAITIDGGTTTCTSTLPANSSCQYGFLPGNQAETGTHITILGSNTTSSVAVTANVSEVIINLSLPTLSFAVGSSGTISVNNTSATTAVQNVQVTIPGGSAIEIDGTSTCTAGGSIAASGSCVLVFTTPANATPETNTSITVSGDNSNAPAVSITTTSTTLGVTSPTAIQTLAADGATTLSITVENTGLTDANNVQMNSPWTGVTLSPSSCGTIAPGATCTFTIQTSTPNIAGQITIQGGNTNAATTPYIAFRAGGGLVFSVSGGVTKVVTEANIFSPIQWGGYNYQVGGINQDSTASVNTCDGKNDGACNTQRIVTCLTSQTGCVNTPPSPINIITYAAGICNQYNDGTFNDWYLPAICEWSNSDNNCSIANIYTNLRQYGFGNIVAGFYWSSTEYAVSPQFNAWNQFFGASGSGYQGVNGKFNQLDVRCVRGF